MTKKTDQSKNEAPSAGSNSLAELAERINTEHQVVVSSAKRGLESAMAAGAMLIEAKVQLAQQSPSGSSHGQWQPWLKQNCTIPDRTVRHYMRLAKHRASLTDENGRLAVLTVEQAIELLAPVKRPVMPPDWDGDNLNEILEWHEQQMEEPFTDYDLMRDNWDHLLEKIMHVADIPFAAWFYLNAHNHGWGDDPLAACPGNALVEAIRLMKPYGEGRARFEVSSMRMIGKVEIAAARLVGRLLIEFDARRKIKTDAEFNERAAAAHSNVMAALEREEERIEREIADVETTGCRSDQTAP
jgi:hypothetical protein